MKKFFVLLTLSFILFNVIRAQSRKPAKADSTHSKTTAKTPAPSDDKADTSQVRFPLVMQANKFSKFDNADLNLSIDEPIKKFGDVDTTDLLLKSCSFEKEANAMILFDRAEMVCGYPEVVMERQKRIKIFNENGKSEGNIKIELNNKFGTEEVLNVEASTINLTNGKIESTKLDTKLIYFQRTSETKSEVVFTMPNVKPGSVIEYRYIWTRRFSDNFPKWDFQCDLPTRYSQFDVFIDPMLTFTALYKKDRPFAKDTVHGFGHVWAMAEIPSSKNEPFMRSAVDALQSLELIISSVLYNGEKKDLRQSWEEVAKAVADDKSFSKPYDQSLHDEDDLIKQTKGLKTEDGKIELLFNQVKTAMKWNENKSWFSKDGIKKAWKLKSGTWAEINMILCHLLNKAGIKAYPLLVSTRDNGKILSNFVDPYQINKLIAYVPVDSGKYYALDASNKYNIYNEVPDDVLNSYGVYLNKEKEKYGLVLLKKDAPVKKVVYIQADIKSDGTMKGTAQINSFSYNKAGFLELYKTLDERKYKEYLTDNDNNLKITALKLENMEVDSLPLTQTIDFNLDLPGTDDKYIYFNPNLFTSLYNNPFINETRVSDIDFGFNRSYNITGRYKIPDGYAVDALPKSMNLVMNDKTIVFKRNVLNQDGYIMVYYVITYKQSFYPQIAYPGIHAYYKKMHEILNEQIVLKKM